MPRLPDVMNLVAWMAALWWAAAGGLVVLSVTHSSVDLHWTTRAYLVATVVFSVVAFAAMGWDKRRAKRAQRRLREQDLHFFEFLGGWPGSLIGQRTFRHKTRKLQYQVAFWIVVTLHLALLTYLGLMWWRGDNPTLVPEPVAMQARHWEADPLRWVGPATPPDARPDG